MRTQFSWTVQSQSASSSTQTSKRMNKENISSFLLLLHLFLQQHRRLKMAQSILHTPRQRAAPVQLRTRLAEFLPKDQWCRRRFLFRDQIKSLFIAPRQNSSGTTSDLVSHLKPKSPEAKHPTDESPTKLLRLFPLLTTLDRSEEPLSGLLSAAPASTTYKKCLNS